MSSRGFLSLVAAVFVLGGLLAGSFLVGLALGGGDDQGVVQAAVTGPPTGGGDQTTSGVNGGSALDQIRQLQSGDLSLEELARIRQQLGSGEGGPGGGGFRGGGPGGDAFRAGFAGGGLSGTIEKIEGNTVTVKTSEGPLQATVVADTIIQRLAEGTLADLLEGLRVTVSGERDESGIVEATSIFITPEGAGDFFDGGPPLRGLPPALPAATVGQSE